MYGFGQFCKSESKQPLSAVLTSSSLREGAQGEKHRGKEGTSREQRLDNIFMLIRKLKLVFVFLLPFFGVRKPKECISRKTRADGGNWIEQVLGSVAACGGVGSESCGNLSMQQQPASDFTLYSQRVQRGGVDSSPENTTGDGEETTTASNIFSFLADAAKDCTFLLIQNSISCQNLAVTRKS